MPFYEDFWCAEQSVKCFYVTFKKLNSQMQMYSINPLCTWKNQSHTENKQQALDLASMNKKWEICVVSWS